MFSVIFPGQGSQMVGMGKELHTKFDIVKKLFNEADEILEFSMSSLILEGPKDQLDLTENTQPAIFLVGYSIFQLLKNEFKLDLNKANFFAGHSLGEYTALASADVLSFSDTLKILKIRGNAMQSAVPKGEGGMLAILGSDLAKIEKIIQDNKKKYECFIANDNSNGQIVVSGKNKDLNLLIDDLKKKSIKNIKLNVSAPFHCRLMNPATEKMKKEINNTVFRNPKNSIISNVSATETRESTEIKDLLIKQIESPVRWRESVIYMLKNGVTKFIEIGPGKVLSGLIKRIERNVGLISVNGLEDLKDVNLND